jgi:hypothetical protein
MKKQYARNKLFNLCLIIGLLFGLMSIMLYLDSPSLWNFEIWFLMAIALICLIASIFTPYCYAFDSEGILAKLSEQNTCSKNTGMEK